MKPRKGNLAGLFICRERGEEMPRKPKRPCGVSGCPGFAEDGCEKRDPDQVRSGSIFMPARA